MEYIIINGKKSTLLNGLIITSLPPITKPKIRATLEEINGVDGDVITKLGYGAYDKTFEIGLSYNYDVDDIIKYFDSSGTITFSNEPDKYYNFATLNQIDFEKLLRFKKAKITLHVQPFKYSNVESTKTYNFTSHNQSLQVRNNGNIYSKPVITITGNGTINLSMNGLEVLTINLNGSIVLDTKSQNAYDPETKDFLNRSVIGDLSNLYLNIGLNTISWTGNISKVEIDYCSRWI